jgi:hypothetical protein
MNAPVTRPDGGRPIKLFTCDLNFCKYDSPSPHEESSAPQDWAFLDPEEYFRWHVEAGANIMFCHAFTFAGYAFYPTRLGPLAPGPGSSLLPRLFDLSRKAGLPFCTYFNCSADLALSSIRGEWLVPGSRNPFPGTYVSLLAPESPWVDLLCARLSEFLRQYPVEWINFDGFTYGSITPDQFVVQPSRWVEKPFREIIGRPMPDTADQITAVENTLYKREIMARLFHRIQETMKAASPGTKAFYNVPFWKPAEEMWIDHPMVNECDMLVAESTDDVVGWLLSIRKPHQRVMTTIIGRGGGLSRPDTWRKWHDAGCDFFGYAWGTPPDFRPHRAYADDLAITRAAYREMP